MSIQGNYSTQARALFQQLDGGKLKDSETIGEKNGRLDKIEITFANLPFEVNEGMTEDQFVIAYNEAMKKAEQSKTQEQFKTQIAEVKAKYEEIKDNKKSFGLNEKAYSDMSIDELEAKYNELKIEKDKIEENLKNLGDDYSDIEKYIDLSKKNKNLIKEMKEIGNFIIIAAEKEEASIVQEKASIVQTCILKAMLAAQSLDSNKVKDAISDLDYLIQNFPEEYKPELEKWKDMLSELNHE